MSSLEVSVSLPVSPLAPGSTSRPSFTGGPGCCAWGLLGIRVAPMVMMMELRLVSSGLYCRSKTDQAEGHTRTVAM